MLGPPGLLSPDPELGDEGAIALDVGVPQVVQQTPLLADQEKEAAAGVVVLGMRLQVLGELPDASVRQRDLNFRRACVPLSALVILDQLAFDFFLYCQTRLASIRGVAQRAYSTEPSDLGSAPARHCAGPSITIACACPNELWRGGISSTLGPVRAISPAPG